MEKLTIQIFDFFCDNCGSKVEFLYRNNESQKYIHVCHKCKSVYYMEIIYPRCEKVKYKIGGVR